MYFILCFIFDFAERERERERTGKGKKGNEEKKKKKRARAEGTNRASNQKEGAEAALGVASACADTGLQRTAMGKKAEKVQAQVRDLIVHENKSAGSHAHKFILFYFVLFLFLFFFFFFAAIGGKESAGSGVQFDRS